MLMQARERNDEVRTDLLNRMLERGFIQDADIGPLRDSVLGGGDTGGLPALPPRTAADQSIDKVTVPSADTEYPALVADIPSDRGPTYAEHGILCAAASSLRRPCRGTTPS
jgi:hypothetical protein